jgi:hypothetical protein
MMEPESERILVKKRPPTTVSDKFRDFIASILIRHGHAKASTVATLLADTNNMNEYRRAFTHVTYDETFNYEMQEAVGDPLLNAAVFYYVRERFPLMVNINWITVLFHFLKSNRVLAELAVADGFVSHILYGPKMAEAIAKNPNIAYNETYRKMVGDVFEAFIGQTCTMFDQYAHIHGVGSVIVYNITKSYLNRYPLVLDYEKVFEPFTRLKNSYDKMYLGPEAALRWRLSKQNDKVYLHIIDGSIHKVTIWGYPLGDRSARIENRVQLGYGEGKDEEEAKTIAAYKALHTLAARYGIKTGLTPVDPFVPSKKTWKEL